MTDETAFRSAFVALLDPVLDSRVYTRRPPSEVAFPHAVISWQISDAAALEGDAHTLWSRQEVQVELREKATVEEAGDSVIWDLYTALDGVKILDVRLRVSSSQRQQDPEDSAVVRHIVTVRYARPSPG